MVKSPSANAGDTRDAGPWVGKVLWNQQWLPTPVILPGESHGQRNLPGYRPMCLKESDTTEATRMYTHSIMTSNFNSRSFPQILSRLGQSLNFK